MLLFEGTKEEILQYGGGYERKDSCLLSCPSSQQYRDWKCKKIFFILTDLDTAIKTIMTSTNHYDFWIKLSLKAFCFKYTFIIVHILHI